MRPGDLLAAARAGLSEVVERYARLVESSPQTSIPIPGSQWTVRDAAVHLAGGNQRHIAYIRGDATPAATLDKNHFDSRTRSQIGDNPESDPKKLADELRHGFSQLMTVTARAEADQPIAYHAGLEPTLAELLCVLLGEYVLHGYDIATALGLPWPIDAGQAALVVGAYRMFLPSIFRPSAAAGLQATYHIDVGGTDPFFVRIADGRCQPLDAASAVDCTVCADPVTALLVQAGRLSQWPAIALGRLTFTGQRPEAGPRFAGLFVFP
jgi:uncharacterized protein (TIGR03083 family)